MAKQYVPMYKRARHAVFSQRERRTRFFIGMELEATDTLAVIGGAARLIDAYCDIANNMTARYCADRKTDPGRIWTGTACALVNKEIT